MQVAIQLAVILSVNGPSAISERVEIDENVEELNVDADVDNGSESN